MAEPVTEATKDVHFDFPEPSYPDATQAVVTIRRSPSIGKMIEALAKAKLAFKTIKKAVENTFYTTANKKAMYADLAAVIEATQNALAENGLAIIQSPIIRANTKEAGTSSLLAHSSGEWIENETVLPATAKAKEYATDGSGKWIWAQKFDAQTCGIAITYSRRYSYQSLVGVAAEEDDDGNSIGEAAGGSKEAAQEVAKKKAAGAVEGLRYEWFDESQRAEITGPESIKTANKELLKPLWDKTAGTLLANAEQLEALKYELDQRGIAFKPKAKPEKK